MHRTPAGNRLHIGIFGRRNIGKSSLLNALAGQECAIVSEVPGTTTDPVSKAMEILPIGPCMLIDTAGIDDEGVLGGERVRRTLGVLGRTDVGLIVVAPDTRIDEREDGLARAFARNKLPFLFVIAKSDLPGGAARDCLTARGLPYAEVSAKTARGMEGLKRAIIDLAPGDWSPVPLVADIIAPRDTVVLVCPIDGAMPQGRLILPQVQVMRDVLDGGAIAVVTRDTELADALRALGAPPRLVITDSQAFETVRDTIAADTPLTSFSIVFARHKGDLNAFVRGVRAVEGLSDGDEILIAEACTHHVQPEDIGRTKIPARLMDYTGKRLRFEVVSGGDFPDDPGRFKLIIACGGCMVTRREIMRRVEKAKARGVPITNYGILLAYLAGILERALEPFDHGAGQGRGAG